MAPIYSSEIGIIPQIIDDERLVRLRNDLSELKLETPLGTTYISPDEAQAPLDIEKLLVLVDPWQSWVFEEQVSLGTARVANHSVDHLFPKAFVVLALLHLSIVSTLLYPRLTCKNGFGP